MGALNAIEIVLERLVAAPPERVWEIVEPAQRLGEWFAFADRGELLEGEGPGRRQRMHGRWGAKRSEIDQVVIAYVPAQLLEWRHEAERLDGAPAPRFARETRFAILLQRADGGTVVWLRSRQEPASALKGIVMRALGGRGVRARMERSLDRLAELVR